MQRRPSVLTLLFVCVMGCFSGRATAQEIGRLVLPGTGLALEDGASSIATNPALSVFDRDTSYSLHYRTGLDLESPTLNLQTVAGGLGMGVLLEEDLGGLPYWVVSSSFGLHIAPPLTFGTNVRWHLSSDGEGSYSGWDLGLAYRPLPWLGFGAVGRNLGVPTDAGLPHTYGLGAVFRPWGHSAAFGLDALQQLHGDGTTTDAIEAHLRLRPKRGVGVRLTGSTDGSYGAGLELALGEWRETAAYDSGGTGAVTVGIESQDQRQHAVTFKKRVPIFEIDGSYPYTRAASLFSRPSQTYPQLIRQLREAAGDPAVVGAVLRIKSTRFSFAQLEELRGLVANIRDQRGPVLAYLDGDGGNAAYFLATSASRIALHPATDLFLVGLQAELQYLRGLLDNVGVEPEFFARGQYKSGPERFTRHTPSESASKQMNALLDDLQGALVDAVAAGRETDEVKARTLVDEGPYDAESAMKSGLVDVVMYPDLIDDAMEALIGRGFETDGDYREGVESQGWARPQQIAVVFITGLITSGESARPGLLNSGSSGSDTVVRAIGEAREEDRVAGLVLRVDSPGGSAFASDAIWHAVRRFQATGRPVVVSMGGTAASGGYYVAAGADQIFAEATTVTGSIGVYGGKFSFADLYDKLGIDVTILNRGRNASMFSTARPFDPVESAAMDRLIGDTYAQFKDRVSHGRGLSTDEVEEIAQGRVWSGSRAKEIGLVDVIGGFFDAVDKTRSLAEIPQARAIDLVAYSGRESDRAEMQLSGVRALLPRLAGLDADLDAMTALHRLEREHSLLLLPFHLEIE